MDEVCRTYNISPDLVRQYVQFGEVFNLLHAGASYLRVWQKGYGAVGVSKKYGKRSFLRYPVLWGLKGVGSLPNRTSLPSHNFPFHEIFLETRDMSEKLLPLRHVLQLDGFPREEMLTRKPLTADPSDLEEWDKKAPPKATTIDAGFEAERIHLRCQVQEWAGLEVDPEAELFAFVGRWSIQKVSDKTHDDESRIRHCSTTRPCKK